MARRKPVRVTTRRGKTIFDPVIDAVGKAAEDYAARQMKALTDMEANRKRVEGFLRGPNR